MIIIHPDNALIHENVTIKVENLQPHKIYKIELRLLHKVGTYRSFGVFRSNNTGTIVLKRDAPIRGSYAGVNERGLFESVEPTDNVRFGGYCHCTPPVDFKYQLIVFDSSGSKIDEKLFHKKWVHPLVERIEIEENYPADSKTAHSKVTGTIFKPPGSGPFPTIIDISGSGGGLNEQKGAALSSRGFVVLCLAFFNYKSLPTNLFDADLLYFQNAAKYMVSLPYTSNRIGIQGVSFGATLVMYISSKIPEIKAVCSINGSWTFDEFTHIQEYGKPPPVAKFPRDGSQLSYINGLMVFKDLCKLLILDDGDEIKFEDTSPDTAFRFVSSIDDLSVPTVFSTNLFCSRLRELNRKIDIHFLPGGHLMDPPCFPCHPLAFSNFAGTFQAYGGEASLHGKSQFDAWEGTVKFFSEHLGAPTPLPDYLAKL